MIWGGGEGDVGVEGQYEYGFEEILLYLDLALQVALKDVVHLSIVEVLLTFQQGHPIFVIGLVVEVQTHLLLQDLFG